MATIGRPRAIVLLLTALVAIVAIVLSSIALTQRTSAPGNGSSALSGIYVDGPTSRPHFFVVLSALSGGRVRGAVDYVYQDGQTSVVFTFRGTSQALGANASSGELTLEPVITTANSSQLQKAPLPALSVTYGPRQLELGECSLYLRVTSLAACTFSLSTNGVI